MQSHITDGENKKVSLSGLDVHFLIFNLADKSYISSGDRKFTFRDLYSY